MDGGRLGTAPPTVASRAAPATFKTKGDAARWLSSVEADKARGVGLDPSAGRARLAYRSAAEMTTEAGLNPPSICRLICMQGTSVRIDLATHEELKRLASELNTTVGKR